MKLFNIKTFISILLLFIAPSLVFAEDSVWEKQLTKLEEEKSITVYYSLSCGCCKDWLAHMKKHGFKVEATAVEDVYPIKREHGLPDKAASCHTAIVDGYVIEGHVPAEDIKRLIKEKPKNIVGLTVPQMPVGTPGMEMGEKKDPFKVFAFDKDGNFTVFNEYKEY